MDPRTTACLGCALSALITFIVLFAVSWDSVDYNEYGIDYSSVTKTVGDKPFGAGRYFLGVGHHFIKFPKTVRTIEFSKERSAAGGPLLSRTSDGLEVHLEISFQYKLNIDSLSKLYNKYSTDYEPVFVRMATDILTDTATNYTADNFFTDRAQIGVSMQRSLHAHFMQFCFASIEFFQLRDVDLPDAFEGAIQLTEVKKQDILKATAEKQRTEVEVETRKMQAEYQAQIVKAMVSAEAKSLIAQNLAEVNSFNLTQVTVAQAYNSLMTTLGLNSSDLLNYIKVKVINQAGGKGKIVSLKTVDP